MQFDLKNILAGLSQSERASLVAGDEAEEATAEEGAEDAPVAASVPSAEYAAMQARFDDMQARLEAAEQRSELLVKSGNANQAAVAGAWADKLVEAGNITPAERAGVVSAYEKLGAICSAAKAQGGEDAVFVPSTDLMAKDANTDLQGIFASMVGSRVAHTQNKESAAAASSAGGDTERVRIAQVRQKTEMHENGFKMLSDEEIKAMADAI